MHGRYNSLVSNIRYKDLKIEDKNDLSDGLYVRGRIIKSDKIYRRKSNNRSN